MIIVKQRAEKWKEKERERKKWVPWKQDLQGELSEFYKTCICKTFHQAQPQISFPFSPSSFFVLLLFCSFHSYGRISVSKINKVRLLRWGGIKCRGTWVVHFMIRALVVIRIVARKSPWTILVKSQLWLGWIGLVVS